MKKEKSEGGKVRGTKSCRKREREREREKKSKQTRTTSRKSMEKNLREERDR